MTVPAKRAPTKLWIRRKNLEAVQSLAKRTTNRIFEMVEKLISEKCDDIGVVNAESTRFMFIIDQTVCFED